MSEFITYKTSSPAGDLISFMAGMKQVYEDTGKKALVYQRLGMPGISYTDSIHPFEDEEKQPVTMNRYMFDMLRPLLLSQEYIEDYVEYKGEDVLFNFDHIRLERFTNQPHGSLNRWYSYVFPDMASNLSKACITIPPTNISYKKMVLINFTQRHRNHIVDYHFLKPHQDNIIFTGLKKERDIFCTTWGLDIPLLEVDNFLQLAHEIKECKFFLGNASMCYQIAEALKVPRILETFPLQPNVIPIGDYAYDFYHQIPLEYYFSKLMNDAR